MDRNEPIAKSNIMYAYLKNSKRNNENKPNRMVPFNLKSEILSKIKRFIKIIKATTGSLNLIITPNEEYYFYPLKM